MVRIFKRIPILFMVLFMLPAEAQKGAVYSYGDTEYMRGLELYEREKYGAARMVFDQLIGSGEGVSSSILSEAYYYRAMSALELMHDDTEYLVHQYLSRFPESPHVNQAVFRLAVYFYDKNSWPQAISWFNRVDRTLLDREQFSEYHFKKGYCHYMRKDYEAARVDFYEILEIESSYKAPATYYYSHIHYTERNYETALMGFREIDSDPLFSSIAPYYISQILYIQKKYEEVIGYAPGFMESVTEQRLAEMSKIVGESYFMLGNYKEAIPYLETYRTQTGSYSAHDRYQLAFAYYSNGEYENASELFEEISYRKSEISQSALYHLADCYMKTGQKQKARAAFSQAANMDFDPKIQQDALFNFAKVTFELSIDPFNEAIRAFEQYIRTYPGAENMDEAYNYLVLAYLKTKNYSLALESIGKIRLRDSEIDRAHQKVAFYRGLELYKNLQFDEAVSTLEIALEYAENDPVIASRTYFWLGEAAYRTGDRETARLYFGEFLSDERAHLQEEYPMCHYSMAYYHFNEEEYEEALGWFDRYLRLVEGENSVMVADAYNRIADCHFVSSRYIRAIEYYEQCIAVGKADVDYAMFQKGFTLGLLDRPLEKVQVLSKLIEEQPESGFVDDALFEIGRSYVVLNRQQDALSYYQQVVEDHPGSGYAAKSLNQLGLIFYNSGEYDKALGYYEQVASGYPGSPEADNALTSIKNIYVRNDNVDGYLAFVTSLGRDITLREQDSLSYTAAEMVYMAGDCQATVDAFKEYLRDFPNGRYLLNAHFYKGDCQLRLQQDEEALESLDYIISQPTNMFTEPALVAASRINYRTGNYRMAADNYRRLIDLAQDKSNLFDAYVGKMRCHFELGEYTNTIDAAQKVLSLDKLQEEYVREANFKIARSFQELGELDFALDFYGKVAREVNSREGAEAKYRMVELLYETEEMDRAEEEVYDFIEMNTPHQYWMGMAFLTLSDIYIAKGDTFSAINSLQSLIDYYTIPDDGIIANAKQRRAALAEEAEQGIAPESETEIPMRP